MDCTVGMLGFTLCAGPYGTAHSSDSCETQTCDGSAGSGLARLPSNSKLKGPSPKPLET